MGIMRLLGSFEALRRAAASAGEPDSAGLPAAAAAPAPASGPRTPAPAECGRPLLTRPLPEKGGAAPVPHRRTFRLHGKKLGAAPDAHPRERRLPGGGILVPRIFGAQLPEATLAAWTLPPRADIGRGGGAPAAPRRLLAKTLERAPRGLERAAAEREAP